MKLRPLNALGTCQTISTVSIIVRWSWFKVDNDKWAWQVKLSRDELERALATLDCSPLAGVQDLSVDTIDYSRAKTEPHKEMLETNTTLLEEVLRNCILQPRLHDHKKVTEGKTVTLYKGSRVNCDSTLTLTRTLTLSWNRHLSQPTDLEISTYGRFLTTYRKGNRQHKAINRQLKADAKAGISLVASQARAAGINSTLLGFPGKPASASDASLKMQLQLGDATDELSMKLLDVGGDAEDWDPAPLNAFVREWIARNKDAEEKRAGNEE